MYAFSLMPMESKGGFDGHLLIPHTYDLLWGSVTFVIVALLMWKLVVPSFVKLADERREKIEGGLQAAERAQHEISAERARMEEELLAARRESATIRQAAQEAAAKTAKQINADAEAQARRTLENATRQLNADRDAARHALHGYVGELAVNLTGQILGEAISDKDLQSRVIDRFLDELEAQNRTQMAVAAGQSAPAASNLQKES